MISIIPGGYAPSRGPGDAEPSETRLAVGADARRDRGGVGANLCGPFPAGAPGAGLRSGAGVAGGPGGGPDGRPGARRGLGKAAVPRARRQAPVQSSKAPGHAKDVARPKQDVCCNWLALNLCIDGITIGCLGCCFANPALSAACLATGTAACFAANCWFC